jgi:hypothetical protein
MRTHARDVTLAALAAAAFLSGSAQSLAAQTVRAFAYPLPGNYDHAALLLRCAEYPTPELRGAALTRQLAFEAEVGVDGRLALPDSLTLLPVGGPLPPARYQTLAIRLVKSCVFRPALRGEAAVASPIRLVVQFPHPAKRT